MRYLRSTIFLLLCTVCTISGAAASGEDGAQAVVQYDRRSIPARTVWVDAFANRQRFSSREAVTESMKKIRDTGADTVILAVKDASGLVLYPSSIAPHISIWCELTTDGSKPPVFPAGYDAVKDSIEVARELGLKIYAGIPVFAEGSQRAGPGFRIGPVFSNPDWETVVLRNGVPERISSYYPFIFVNPVIPSVQNYELSLMEEVISRYDFDGITLDYCRFASYNADFSDFTRRAFEQHLGTVVTDWPKDVLVDGARRSAWLEWRSQVIKSFVEKARETVRRANPDIRFSAYYGGWYRHHWGTGVNWASRDFQPGSSMAAPQYKKTGMAELYDTMMLGYYFERLTLVDAENNPNIPSVEAAIDQARWVTKDVTPLSGGLYLMQYKDQPQRLEKAIRLIRSSGQGVLIFDFYWLDRYGLWEAVRRGWTDAGQG